MKYILLILTLSFAVIACKKQDNATTSDSSQEVLNTLSTQANTKYLDFKAQSALFKEQVAQLSTPPTQEEIESLKATFKTLHEQYETLEPFIMGEVNDDYIHQQLNSWPFDSTFLNQDFAQVTTFSTTDFETLSNAEIGLPAVEFLLFTKADSITTSPKYAAYLTYLSQSIAVNGNRLFNSWTSYTPSFLNNQLERRQNPINILVNQVVFVIELIKNKKVAGPFEINDYTGAYEVPFAQWSRAAILSNVRTLKTICMGENSLNTLLIERGKAELANTVENYFTQIDANLAENQLFDTPEAGNITLSENLFELLTDLEKLYKYEIADVLNTTIYIGSDDGD